MKQFPANQLIVRNSTSYLVFKMIGGLLMIWVGCELWSDCYLWIVSLLFFGVSGYWVWHSSAELIYRKPVFTLNSKGILLGEKQFIEWKGVHTQIITESEVRNIRYILKIYSPKGSYDVPINGIGLSLRDLQAAIDFYRNQESK